MPITIGELGQTIGPLRPGGVICVSGRRFPARSVEGLLEAGSWVIVTGSDNFEFLVRARNSVGNLPGLSGFGLELPTREEIHEERNEEQVDRQQSLTRWERFEFGTEEYLLLGVSAPMMVAGYFFFGLIGLLAGLLVTLVIIGYFLFLS
jgi:hypothetical protein